MTMKCDFCNQEFPESELETKTGALHDSGHVRSGSMSSANEKLVVAKNATTEQLNSRMLKK